MLSLARSYRKFICAAALALVALALLVGCAPPDTATSAADDKHVLKITKDNFKTEVLASTQPVLVDFWAVWCGPCKMVAPVVAELAVEFEGKAKVGKVDVDAETDLAKQYDISAIPSLLIFKDGKVVDQIVGVSSKAQLKEKLQKFVSEAAPATAPPKS